MPNIQKSLKSLKNPPKPSELSGSLGLSPTVINVPTRLGFSYVRLLGNTNEVIQAYNSTVSATFDVPVTVQWDGTKYVVIGRDVNRYTSWPSSPYLPLHGLSHEFGGGDTTWILQEQFYPLRVYPSGTSLQIAPYVYNWLGAWKSGGNTGTSTITLPSDSSKQSVMLLYIDGTTSNPTWVPGTEAPINLTKKSDLIPYLPSFQMSLGIPLVMARIPSGTTSWTWDNLYDVRQFFGGLGSGSGSSTTGSSGGNVYGPATNHDSYLPQWNGANSKILKDGLPVVTSVGTPGTDTNIPTEKAVRTAISAISGSSGTGSNYALPTGSSSILGGFRVGSGLAVYPDGTLNATGGGSGSSGSPGFQTLTDGSSIAWNLALGSGQVTLGGNRTLANPTNMAAGQHYFLTVIQDGTGNRLISTWGSAYKFPGYVKPTLSTYLSRADVISFECDGTSMYYTGIVKGVTNTAPTLSYVTNLLTWLRADVQVYSDNGTTLCNDTDTVYLWKDQSGNTRNAVQTSSGIRPQYRTNILSGLPVIRFNGSSNYIDISGLNGGDLCTFFMVVVPSSTTPIGIFDSSSGPVPPIRNEPAGNWDWYGTAPATSMALANTNPVLMEFHHVQSGGRTVAYYKNGTLVSTNTDPTTTPTDWTTPSLGAINHGYAYYLGDIAEFLVYGENVSSGNRAIVEAYLMTKYGI